MSAPSSSLSSSALRLSACRTRKPSRPRSIYNFLMVVPTVILGFPGLRRAGEVLRERLEPG